MCWLISSLYTASFLPALFLLAGKCRLNGSEASMSGFYLTPWSICNININYHNGSSRVKNNTVQFGLDKF